jgi:hypothetical protein
VRALGAECHADAAYTVARQTRDNPDQADTDHDGYGDACDRCPFKADPGPIGFSFTGLPLQPDYDGDGIPDGCDFSFTVDGDPGPSKIKPDSRWHAVHIEGGAEASVRLPFIVCDPECPEFFDPRDRLQLLQHWIRTSASGSPRAAATVWRGSLRIDSGCVSIPSVAGRIT